MKKFKLYGFSSPGCSSPSFLTPVFENEDDLYVQIIDRNDRIEGFEKISVTELKSIQGEGDGEYENGADAVFGVSDRFHEVTYNRRNQLKGYLRSKILDYIDKPFFYKDVSEFCDHILPEFYSCKNDSDFLLRQVVSNVITEYVFEKNVKIKKKTSPNKNVSGYFQLNELYKTRHEEKLKITSELPSLRDTFKDFVCYAQKKHRRLSEIKEITDSIEAVDMIFPVLVDHADYDFTNIRDNLMSVLHHKINEDKDRVEQYKPKLNKELKKTYSNNLYELRGLEKGSITPDGLSFIIFVTSRFTQEAQKRKEMDKDVPCHKHITNFSR